MWLQVTTKAGNPSEAACNAKAGVGNAPQLHLLAGSLDRCSACSGNPWAAWTQIMPKYNAREITIKGTQKS